MVAGLLASGHEGTSASAVASSCNGKEPLRSLGRAWIGASHSIAGSGIEYFLGCLDEVEIAQQVVGAADVAAIYAAGANGKCKSTP